MRTQLFDLRQIILVQTTALLIRPDRFYTPENSLLQEVNSVYDYQVKDESSILYRRKKKVSADTLVIKSPLEIFTGSEKLPQCRNSIFQFPLDLDSIYIVLTVKAKNLNKIQNQRII